MAGRWLAVAVWVENSFVGDPTLGVRALPWGNHSILFRDPDGNLVDLFTPVTEDAIKRFRRQ